MEVRDRKQWEAEHEQGEWDHLSTVEELPRYSLIVGYIRHLGPARSILDVGCGQGLLAEHLAESDFDQYLGVDVAASAIARTKHLEHTRVRFMVGEEPPVTYGDFDFIVCNESLYCLPDPRKSLDLLRGRIEPTGYLLTAIWRHRGDRGLERLIQARFDLVHTVGVDSRSANIRTHTRVSCWRPK